MSVAEARSDRDPLLAISPELRRELEGGGWMYHWHLAPGVATPLLGANLAEVHRTRSEMIEPVVRDALAAAGPGACAIDLACNEGWFSHRLLEWGAERVVGIDVREQNIRRATLVRDQLGIPPERMEFRLSDVLALDPSELGRYDVVLCLGLIYHMEQPMQALRIARQLAAGLCVVESQLVRQDRALLFSNGSPNAFLKTEMAFGAWFEEDEANPLASADNHVLSLVPNRAALTEMVRHAGFPAVATLRAKPDHDPQYVLGDRGIVTGRVHERSFGATGLPMPPLHLIRRVGTRTDVPDPIADYETEGRLGKTKILDLLGDDWTWSGKRVLDFGAGAGRVLRQFHREASEAEMWGCDIDVESVEWLRGNLSPPLHGFIVNEEPGLPFEDDSLDLIWAASVFTHITDHWAGWLLEVHRALRVGGVFLPSFLGGGMAAQLLALPWDEERTGMLVVAKGTPWNLGGPAVFHSEWWLREHWGRLFEFVRFDDHDRRLGEQGWMALRKRDVTLTAEELERPADDPREVEALRHNIEHLHAFSARWHAAQA
jgi:tRNA (mo5U34)-methyltransferase